MKKKIALALLVLVVVTLLAFVVTACDKGGDDDVNTITIWAGGQWTGSDLENLESFIEEYNRTNDQGLTVVVQPKSDMETALATAVRNNRVPDILIWDRFNTPAYAEEDALLDMTSYIQRDGVDTSIFNDAAMQEMTYNGKTYGLPLDLDVWGVYVNMDMVNAYNNANPGDAIVLNDDWTWDDMYSVAQKLTKREGGQMTVAGYAGHVTHQHLFKYMCSQSQDFLTPSGDPNFDNQETRDILSFFKKVGGAGNGIWESGLCEKSNFTSGTLGMIDQSLYFIEFIEKYAPNMNYKFMPQPRYSVNGVVQEGAVNGGMLGGFGLAFPNPQAKFRNDEFYAKVEKAWTFAKDWLLDENIQRAWTLKTGTLSAMKALCTEEVIRSNPDLRADAAETLARATMYLADYKIRPQIPAFLTLQTQVIDAQVKAFTEGSSTLEQTITNLILGCRDFGL